MYKKVYAVLPKAGLANQLFVVAQALSFLHDNENTKIIICQSWKCAPRAFLMRGGRLDLYYFLYKSKGGFIDELRILFSTIVKVDYRVFTFPDGANSIIVDQLPHWKHYFRYLAPYRDFIKLRLCDFLDADPIPMHLQYDVCIHYRQGDFRIVNDADYSSAGLARLPFTYIEKLVEYFLSLGLGIALFTDGPLFFGLDSRVKVINSAPLESILIMSKGKIICTSKGSTFSLWAAFLSNALVIHHHSDSYGLFGEFCETESTLFDDQFRVDMATDAKIQNHLLNFGKDL